MLRRRHSKCDAVAQTPPQTRAQSQNDRIMPRRRPPGQPDGRPASRICGGCRRRPCVPLCIGHQLEDGAASAPRADGRNERRSACILRLLIGRTTTPAPALSRIDAETPAAATGATRERREKMKARGMRRYRERSGGGSPFMQLPPLPLPLPLRQSVAARRRRYRKLRALAALRLLLLLLLADTDNGVDGALRPPGRPGPACRRRAGTRPAASSTDLYDSATATPSHRLTVIYAVDERRRKNERTNDS